MSEQITIIASFDPNKHAYSARGDGSGKFTLETSADQVSKLSTLYQWFQKPLKITIEPWDGQAVV